MKRLFWNVDYCDGTVFRIWWLGFFQIAKWKYLPWYSGWSISWNNDKRRMSTSLDKAA